MANQNKLWMLLLKILKAKSNLLYLFKTTNKKLLQRVQLAQLIEARFFASISLLALERNLLSQQTNYAFTSADSAFQFLNAACLMPPDRL